MEATKQQLRDALERIVAELGETQHDWPSQALRKAYNDADNLLHPDEFRERFFAKARVA